MGASKEAPVYVDSFTKECDEFYKKFLTKGEGGGNICKLSAKAAGKERIEKKFERI